MAKSLGNFYTLRDLLAKGFTGREIRHLLLTAHYRAPFNFTIENLIGSRTALARLDECFAKLREIAGQTHAAAEGKPLTDFSNAMDDDLNVSAAWGRIFDWIREVNRLLYAEKVSAVEASSALAAWQRIDAVFGVGQKQEADAPPRFWRYSASDRPRAKPRFQERRCDSRATQVSGMGH